MTIRLLSDSFDNGDAIPSKFTCDGENLSPHLRWDTLPEHILSFAILCEDPDAPGGVFTHWMIINITPDIMELPAGLKKENRLENGATQGINDFGFPGYGGPCNPVGTEHRFIFKIYALDTTLNLNPGFEIADFINGLDENILDEGQLMGKYTRE